MGAKQISKEVYEYNLTERAIIYSGIRVGAFTPIAITRYTIFDPNSANLGTEAMKWALSTVASIPYLFGGAIGGAVLGILGAKKLQSNRMRNSQERKSDLEANFLDDWTERN